MQQYDGQNCINTWPLKAGTGPCGDLSAGEAECSHAHRFERNRCALLFDETDYSPGAGGCPPDLGSMAHLADNEYFTPSGDATMKGCDTLKDLQAPHPPPSTTPPSPPA